MTRTTPDLFPQKEAERYDRTVQVRVSTDLYRKLKSYAERKGQSLSDAARDGIGLLLSPAHLRQEIADAEKELQSKKNLLDDMESEDLSKAAKRAEYLAHHSVKQVILMLEKAAGAGEERRGYVRYASQTDALDVELLGQRYKDSLTPPERDAFKDYVNTKIPPDFRISTQEWDHPTQNRGWLFEHFNRWDAEIATRAAREEMAARFTEPPTGEVARKGDPM